MQGTWWVDLNQLDTEQQAVISLPPDGHHLVLGPPGSGKTNLLLLRAKYLYKKGLKNIAVIVSTRTLQQFIVSGAKGYDFPSERVFTHTRWQMNVLTEYGAQIAPPDGYAEQRTYFNEELTTLIDVRKLKTPYDAILIDEGQDYTLDELKLFLLLSKRLFAVADSKQQIYRGKVSERDLTSLFSKVSVLKNHYRNGVRICQLADEIAKTSEGYVSMLDGCKYDEKGQESSIASQEYKDLDSQLTAAIEKIGSQILAYPKEYIGVIAPKRDDVALIAEALYDSDLGDLCVSQGSGETIEFSPDKPICICTVHAAKGLEFRATHILAAEQFANFSHNKNLVFTAVTRTKTALSVYHSGILPGFFDQALNVVKGESQDFDLADLFGGAK